MNDEHLRDQINEGLDADSFISNPRYQKAKVLVRANLFREFEKTGFKDSQERDEIWRKLQALSFIENNLERAIRDGENASKTLLSRIKDKVLRVA